MKQKILILFAVLLSALSAFAGKTITYTTHDGYNFPINVNPEAFDANIVSHTRIDGQGEIVFDKDVTVIGEKAFWFTDIISIDIPNSVTRIGEQAFDECFALESIVIPNSVTEIGNYAFAHCGSLRKITIGNSVKELGVLIFANSNNIQKITALCTTPPDLFIDEWEGETFCITFEEFKATNCILKVPAEAEEAYKSAIGWGNFKIIANNNRTIYYTKHLDEFGNDDDETITPNSIYDFGVNIVSNTYENGIGQIVLDEDVTEIGSYAFENSYMLESIDLPSTVTKIGESAFENSGLIEIELPNGLTEIGYSAFKNSAIRKIEIPNTVTTIEAYAFEECRNISSITIPSSVTSISYQLFKNCSQLRRINIPNTVTEIQQCAFWGCSDLRNIELPESLETIEGYLFQDCSSLKTITIPSSVKTIMWDAFNGCYNLESIDLPNTVEFIEERAFFGCTSLKSVVIPESLEFLRDGIFGGCTSLEAFYGKFASEDHRFLIQDGSLKAVAPAGLTTLSIPVGVNEIGGGVCEHFRDLKSIEFPASVTYILDRAFSGCSGLTSLELPNSLKGIGQQAFSYCTGLTELRIPNSVRYIGQDAFEWCDNLESVVVGNGVESIGERAFDDCYKLKTVILGKSLKNIGNDAFSWCKNIEKIISQNPKAPYIYSGTFEEEIKETCKLTVPERALDSYRTNYNWMGFKNINESTEIKFSVNNLWYIVLPELIDAVEVTYKENRVSYIGGDIVIPAKVEHEGKTYVVLGIGDEAFYNCNHLTSVEISEGIGYIGKLAFYGCNGLHTTIIPPSLAGFGKGAFGGGGNPHEGPTTQEKRKTVIAEGTEVIPEESFEEDDALDILVLPSTIKLIKSRAFAACWFLGQIFCYAEVPPTLGEAVFAGVDHDECMLFIPKGSKEAYMAADQWKDFKIIMEMSIEDASIDLDAITTSDSFSTKTYNLSGQRVGDGFKGIVIQNGRKVLRK